MLHLHHRVISICIAVTFTWIPSHVGIKADEEADHAAKQASLRADIQVSLPPGTLQIKTKTSRTLFNLQLARDNLCTDTRSASTSWYKTTTNLQRFTPPKNLHCQHLSTEAQIRHDFSSQITYGPTMAHLPPERISTMNERSAYWSWGNKVGCPS
ncbi:hypothetical protein SK128_006112 [Halocaridina rubra]|uniref:RNase H type-1 domain-containing protein n=1 Tax=Halocaridina rubra TaxID=373956 RepID=A0AAN8WYN8_HALRR